MASFISKRLLRSYQSLHSLGRRCFNSPSAAGLYGERLISAQRILVHCILFLSYAACLVIDYYCLIKQCFFYLFI